MSHGCILNISGWGWKNTCEYADRCEGAKDPKNFYNRCRYGEKKYCKHNPENKLEGKMLNEKPN